jgi:FkbM family methyltransferase
MLMLRRAIALVHEALGDGSLEGSQFLDVGANIGTTTVSALIDGPFGSAVCFEPEPQNLVNLRLNLVLNGLEDRGTAVGVAVSDSDGTVQFVANTAHSGQGWVATDDSRLDRLGAGDQAISVPTMTIDGLVDSGVIALDRVGLLWIDAQSHEGHILAGGGRLLETGVPIVLEWYPRALDRLGDRVKLQNSVAEHYTHFIDLRAKPGSDGTVFEILEADTLCDYVEPFSADSGRRYTDILILRLPAGVAESLDVAKTLRRHEQAAAAEKAATKSTKAKVASSRGRRGTDAKRARKVPDSARAEVIKAKRALLDTDQTAPDTSGGQTMSRRERKHSAEAKALRDAKKALAAKRGGASKGAGAAKKARAAKKRAAAERAEAVPAEAGSAEPRQQDTPKSDD